MSVKPQYLFIYKNNSAVDDLLDTSPFRYDKPISYRRGREQSIIDYEHFTLKCIKKYEINDNLRGFKTWQILIEGCLYDNITQRQRDEILIPLMCPYSILGGRVVRI